MASSGPADSLATTAGSATSSKIGMHRLERLRTLRLSATVMASRRAATWVDDGAAAVGCGDAAADEAARTGPGHGCGSALLSVSCVIRGLLVARRGSPMVAVGSSCSISCLQVRLSACSFQVSVDIAGRLGGSLDRVGCGHAELGRPALDVRPKSTALMEVLFAGQAGQGHGGDGGVAVQGLAGQPGHFPARLGAGCRY